MRETKPDAERAAAPDFLRVASIAIVAWYHFWQQSWLNPNFEVWGHAIDIYPIIRCGYMFVYNLILISGFVLMLQRLNGKYKSVWQFYKNRAVRILPSYLFCIAVFLFLSNQKGGTYDWFGGREHMKLDLIAHLTFTHNLFPQSYNGTGLNVALWTLAVEMQFYLIFPLLGRCFERRPAITYFGMVLISFIYKLYVHTRIADSTMFINRLPAMLDVFANGMLGAYLYSKLKSRRRLGIAHLLLMIAACAGIYTLVRDISYVNGDEEQRMAQMWGASFMSVFGAIFLVSGSLSFKAVRLLISNPPLRFLSALSYNFYMWHQPVAVWLKKLKIPYYAEEYPNVSGNVVWQHEYMRLCIVFALLVAINFTYLIEKPCARFFSSHGLSDLKKTFRRKKHDEASKAT